MSVSGEKETMAIEKVPCSECGGSLKTRRISQSFEREGTVVEVSGVSALVCGDCGEIYFQPGGAEAVGKAANSLFELARRNKQHKGRLSGRVIKDAIRQRKPVVADVIAGNTGRMAGGTA